MAIEYMVPVWEAMGEEVKELEEIEEVEVIKEVDKVEEYPQYMHPPHGIKRPPPPTQQPLSMERVAGWAFLPLDVQPPL